MRVVPRSIVFMASSLVGDGAFLMQPIKHYLRRCAVSPVALARCFYFLDIHFKR